MRKILAAALAIVMIFALCACGRGEVEEAERDCGVFVTVEATDIYTVSCGTHEGSESAKNADGSVIEAGSVFHFDFAGDAAEGTESAMIDYSVCAYDENLDIIAEGSFSSDFSNMAKYELIITEDHHILFDGEGYSYGGDIVVSYEDSTPVDGVTLMSTAVSMPTRTDAADAVNSAIAAYNDTFSGEHYNASKEAYGKGDGTGTSGSLESFAMSRTVRVTRGDSAILCFRMADRVNLGYGAELTITCHSFDPQTGKELGISDIAKDTDKFTDYCAEQVLIATTEEERFLTESMIFVDGYTDNIRSLISDGHWYLSSEGLVISANPGDISTGYYEFVIPYEDLDDLLKDEYMPAEFDGGYGNLSLQYAENLDTSALNFLNASPDGGTASITATVSGSVYGVTVYTGTYNTTNGKFTQIRQLLYCSDMMRGAAVTIDHALKDSTPDLMVSFTSPGGTEHNLLVSADSASGGLLVMDLSGGTQGIPVDGSVIYDINGDGADENLKLSKDGTYYFSVGSVTAESDITEDAVARLYDLNGDGKMEIYLSGKDSSGEAVTYCFSFGKTFNAICSPLQGVISEFNGNRVFLQSEMDVLGKHQLNAAYCYNVSENTIAPMSGFEYIFGDGETVTTSAAITLKDGTSVPADTKLTLVSTDGSSYVKVTADGEISGTIEISKDTLGSWIVSGQPYASCIKE